MFSYGVERLAQALEAAPSSSSGASLIVAVDRHPINICKKEVIAMKPTKSDLPQGTLDLLILKVVALGPVHGYAIAQRLDQVSRGVVQVPQGSLYPALHRLENRGLLAADWKATETGREAKFYRLTRKGRKQLETESQSWQRLTEAVGLILNLSEGGAK
jgi:PadR family transcriptional regulator, regulatory protein PadR